MKSLARLSYRKRWWVLGFWILLFVVIIAISQSVGSAFSNSFSLPGTDSLTAQNILAKGFPHQSGDSDQIVFAVKTGTLTAHDEQIETMLAQVSRLPDVGNVISPFATSQFTGSATSPTLISNAGQINKSGTIAFAVVNFTKIGLRLPVSVLQRVETVGRTAATSGVEVQFGGNAFGQLDAPKGSPGEKFGILAALIILTLAFGSLFAALLPLAVALFALGIAIGAGDLLSHALTIAQFSPILNSLIGLGVGIDYALFIVTRTRQELKQGATLEEAIVTAVNTSGRAVLFAGLTVCVALLGMLALQLGFLNGVAVMASVTVVITMFASVTLLPALLGFQKNRVLSRRERRRLASEGPISEDLSPFWMRWSTFVSRRPKSLSVLALLLIVAAAVPYFSLHLGSSDQGENPPSSTTRQAYDLLAKGFGPGFNGPLVVVAELHNAADHRAFAALDQRAKTLADVAAVSPITVSQTGTVGLIEIVPRTSPQDTRTSQLIVTLRQRVIPQLTASTHTAMYVGGLTAVFDDFASVLNHKLPLFVGVIVLLGCLLLMIAFRSVVVPVTAAVMNLLAAAASFGLVVAVFQWGWGSSLLNSGTGPVESYLPIIMIAILFGLSMDYQVFLVSRMHEEWTKTGDNELAVWRGQANTGRVITAAALIMVTVFMSFAFGGERVIAEFGVGLGGAVLMDAFILRTVLVPALMHFFGKANWWMPRWLDRIIPNVAVEAHD